MKRIFFCESDYAPRLTVVVPSVFHQLLPIQLPWQFQVLRLAKKAGEKTLQIQLSVINRNTVHLGIYFLIKLFYLPDGHPIKKHYHCYRFRATINVYTSRDLLFYHDIITKRATEISNNY